MNHVYTVEYSVQTDEQPIDAVAFFLAASAKDALDQFQTFQEQRHSKISVGYAQNNPSGSWPHFGVERLSLDNPDMVGAAVRFSVREGVPQIIDCFAAHNVSIDIGLDHYYSVLEKAARRQYSGAVGFLVQQFFEHWGQWQDPYDHKHAQDLVPLIFGYFVTGPETQILMRKILLTIPHDQLPVQEIVESAYQTHNTVAIEVLEQQLSWEAFNTLDWDALLVIPMPNGSCALDGLLQRREQMQQRLRLEQSVADACSQGAKRKI